MGTDPRNSAINRYLQNWERQQSVRHGRRRIPAKSGLQPDGDDCCAGLLVGQCDHHAISEIAGPAGARIKIAAPSVLDWVNARGGSERVRFTLPDLPQLV